MQGDLVGMIAAMPEEIAPLLKRAGRFRKEKLERVVLYEFTLAGRPVVLVESGMGLARAAAATRLLLERFSPRILINFGFCGAVRGGPAVGDLVLARRVLRLDKGIVRRMASPDSEIADRVMPVLGEGQCRAFAGTFITTGETAAKGWVSSLLPEEEIHPVLEMETAAIAEVAAGAGVPMLALRAVSDAAGEELSFSIEEFTDGDLNLRISRIIATVAARPRIIPQLMRLARNSRLAANTLALALERAVTKL